MSLTLGEKLRQAREERGLSLSEVAEQTRISRHYLEKIENDDYRTLPGGIFNKGFVKSFAKLVEMDEAEAMLDYASLLAASEAAGEEPLKPYRPEVLTDDRNGRSMIPTVIVAVIILGLMTVGVLYLVDYLQNRPATPAPVAANSNPANNPATSNANTPPSAGNVPEMATLKVEFKALSQQVHLSATTDGSKSDNVVAAGTTATFEPKVSLTLNYNRWNAAIVQLLINGKQITLPAAPIDNPKAQRIEFEINKNNLAQIWNSGAISTTAAPAAADANANVDANVATALPATQATASPRQTPISRPSAAVNTAVNAAATPVPTPTRKVVVVSNAPSNKPQ